jgi:hypothetical protein
MHRHHIGFRRIKHYAIDDEGKALIQVLLYNFETRGPGELHPDLRKVVDRLKEVLR